MIYLFLYKLAVNFSHNKLKYIARSISKLFMYNSCYKTVFHMRGSILFYVAGFRTNAYIFLFAARYLDMLKYYIFYYVFNIFLYLEISLRSQWNLLPTPYMIMLTVLFVGSQIIHIISRLKGLNTDPKCKPALSTLCIIAESYLYG